MSNATGLTLVMDNLEMKGSDMTDLVLQSERIGAQILAIQPARPVSVSDAVTISDGRGREVVAAHQDGAWKVHRIELGYVTFRFHGALGLSQVLPMEQWPTQNELEASVVVLLEEEEGP